MRYKKNKVFLSVGIAIAAILTILVLLLSLNGGTQLFHLKAEDVECIQIPNSPKNGQTVTYQSSEDIELLVEYINGFFYYSIFPTELPGTTSRCPVTVVRKDGIEIPFTVFSEGVVLGEKTYLCHSPYIDNGPYFQPLVDLIAEAAETARASR